ncbi:Protein Y39B6A.34 a [Aphelenchoides avenae]|nr:Protein Y39B6A.34 a [Aphelenchus avenae]
MSREDVRLDRRYDWVGPADKISKIRPIKLRRVNGETGTERDYRTSREELNEWNSSFWRAHNQLFDEKKLQFVTQKKKELGPLGQISADDMSQFYKRFLDERSTQLAEYNWQWYRRNFALIWPALKVNVIRLRRLLRR